MTREYNLPNGKTALFEYDEFGIGKVSIDAMDYLIAQLSKKNTTFGKWHPFRQERNSETGLWELAEPLPKKRQHILVSITVDGHERVQDDYFFDEGNGAWLTSGYEICAEAVAWMEMPEPYREEQK